MKKEIGVKCKKGYDIEHRYDRNDVFKILQICKKCRSYTEGICCICGNKIYAIAWFRKWDGRLDDGYVVKDSIKGTDLIFLNQSLYGKNLCKKCYIISRLTR